MDLAVLTHLLNLPFHKTITLSTASEAWQVKEIGLAKAR